MVLGRFAIHFDNADAAYFPGQSVAGTIHIWNSEPKFLKGIYVVCRGMARVRFTQEEMQLRTVRRRHRPPNREYANVTVVYRANEDYFYQRIPIYDKGGERFELPSGRHQYPFSFELPPNIPSSFEGAHGHVRYTVRAVAQRERKWNYECKIPFTVNTILNLNNTTEATMPAQAEDSKTLGLFCCQSGPITARVWIDRAGYVPGESILFNAEVENLSQKAMRGTKVQLIELARFHTENKTKEAERIVKEHKRGEFHAMEFWEEYPIVVPPVAPSNLPNCSIMSVTYLLRFSVDPGLMSFNLTVPLNILIGNVPLRSCFSQLQQRTRQALPAGNDFHESNGNPFFVQNLPEDILPADQYPDMPPPTYEECLFGADDVRDENDSEFVNDGNGIPYTPRYLTYH